MNADHSLSQKIESIPTRLKYLFNLPVPDQTNNPLSCGTLRHEHVVECQISVGFSGRKAAMK